MKRTSLMMSALIVTATALLGSFASSHNRDLCDGFVPENTMKIPVGWAATMGIDPAAAGGLSEAQFNSVLDRVEKIYAPEIAKAGGKFKINRKWTDATVNASAQQFGSSWVINMYGGLARHPEITIEGFALVACHETGHHLGGAPKVAGGWMGDDWATNEGGADYFATLKCLRRYFSEDDNATILAAANVDPYAKKVCEKQFTNKTDQLICQRTSLSGASVAGLFMDLRKETVRPRFDTPDKKVVTTMFDDHPETQCRMDTYFAGAVCPVAWNVPNSNTDYREGSCVAGTHDVGFRPLCWFKP